MKIKLTILFCFLAFLSFGQTSKKDSAQQIEKYIWKGQCNPASSFSKKMMLVIYSDSTFMLKSFECKKAHNTKKEWKEHKKWAARGTWTVTNGQRLFLQSGYEINIKQFDGYVMYNHIIKLTKQ